MAFVWKEHKDIWKGEGIYHLTFAVENRMPLLGSLRGLPHEDTYGHIATVDYTDLGVSVYQRFNALRIQYPEMEILGKQMMPDHFHVVVWMHEGFEGSIKMIARGFSQGCSKIAREMVAEGSIVATLPFQFSSLPSLSPQSNCGNINGMQNTPVSNGVQADPYDCGNSARTLFSKPYIRTLSHAGQLKSMLEYVHRNPDDAWMRKTHRDYYTIRRRVQLSGLHFDMMGKSRLLDYPDVQVIALSRSLTQDQIDAEVAKAVRCAETGAITYTAAMNDGEKAVSKAIREKGFPLVVMMLDGFPPEGSESARYFHPSGVYHTACGQGRLLLLAPISDNYNNPELISLTDAELSRKAAEKGFQFFPIPHDSKRWRMIAGNVMLRMIADTRKRPLP